MDFDDLRNWPCFVKLVGYLEAFMAFALHAVLCCIFKLVHVNLSTSSEVMKRRMYKVIFCVVQHVTRIIGSARWIYDTWLRLVCDTSCNDVSDSNRTIKVITVDVR